MKEERLQDMIDILSNNPSINTKDLEAELEKISEQRIKLSEKKTRQHMEDWGRESEEIVKNVIEGFDFVNWIRETKQGGWEDIDGTDLVVHFEKGNYVNVQVKSSEAGKERFERNRGRRGKRLRVRRLILLNGRDDEKDIQKLFLRELKITDNYWRKRKHPILTENVRKKVDNLLVSLK